MAISISPFKLLCLAPWINWSPPKHGDLSSSEPCNLACGVIGALIHCSNVLPGALLYQADLSLFSIAFFYSVLNTSSQVLSYHTFTCFNVYTVHYPLLSIHTHIYTDTRNLKNGFEKCEMELATFAECLHTDYLIGAPVFRL